MKNNTIFIIFETPHTYQKHKDYLIDKLLNDFRVELITFNQSGNKLIWDDSYNCIEFTEIEELRNYIKSFDVGFYVFYMTNVRILKKLGIDRYKSLFLFNPSTHGYLARQRNKRKIPKNLFDLKRFIRNSYLVSLFYNFINKEKYDYVFAVNNFWPEITRNLIRINHSKFYEIQQNCNDKLDLNLDCNYAVFIDSNMTDHPDDTYLNPKKRPNRDRYFRILNEFFDVFEKTFKTKIIIALDPTNNFNNSFYNNRICIKYSTCYLIKNSNYVISHSSTSTLQAVYFNKPIINISYDEIFQLKPSIHERTIAFSRKLATTYINLDKYDKINLNLDKKKYNKFLKKHFVYNEDLDNYQILKETFNKLFLTM